MEFVNIHPDAVKMARLQANLTQDSAAALVYVSRRAWQSWELGQRDMPSGMMELFLIKTDPEFRKHWMATTRKLDARIKKSKADQVEVSAHQPGTAGK